ncbi:oxidoreductase [Kitasatospora sp. NPDC057223]|uniref:oxidoreductase n=1 Tax=Kitasatospora sp. NPDC057223 TaxID=3346055 RepID=UPI0036414106
MLTRHQLSERPAPVLDGLLHLAERSTALLDHRRGLTPALAARISAAGFARHFVPRRWGGTAGLFHPLADAVATLAEACASTAWCASLYAAHGRLAAYLPERGQQELWGGSPDVRIAAALAPPAAEAVPDSSDGDNGWRLEGTWSFVSGVEQADWVLLAGPGAGDRGPDQRLFAVPVAAVDVLDTWRNSGLRGTGSNTVALGGVFVPEHRTFTIAELGRVRPGDAHCHAVPFQLTAPLQFAAPVLGAARGALRDWTRVMAAKCRPDGRPARESAAVQQVLAEASAQIHAAALLLCHAADRADTAVYRSGQGGAAPLPAAGENQRDLAVAAGLCTSAVARLFQTAGARCQSEEHPLQRRWRDVSAAAGHMALDLEAAAAVYAPAVFAAAAGAGGGRA